MTELRYEAPGTAEDAVALLAAAGNGARVLAGGTDVLVQMRSGRIAPSLLVDVKGIAEMRAISQEASGLRVGAAVPCMELVESDAFARRYPGVADGVRLIGSVQVRGRATLGGNLCNASPAADSVPAMIAAGARATVIGPRGRRELPVEEVASGPGRTTLTAGEFVVSFLLPNPDARSGAAYMRFTPRTEMDIAVVGVGISLTLDAGGTCTAARVALGAVAERALLVPDAAATLIGTRVDAAAIDALAAAASAACRPIDDKRGTKAFRIRVAGVLARRTAVLALERARNGS